MRVMQAYGRHRFLSSPSLGVPRISFVVYCSLACVASRGHVVDDPFRLLTLLQRVDSKNKETSLSEDRRANTLERAHATRHSQRMSLLQGPFFLRPSLCQASIYAQNKE